MPGLATDDGRAALVDSSGWSCLGLVKHLALDVERFWFRAVVAGEAVELASGDEAWQVSPDESAEAVFDLYRRESALADAVIAATGLDAEPAWWPRDMFGDWPSKNLAETLLHVIAETACHAGHLDAARELIDRRTWLVLPQPTGPADPRNSQGLPTKNGDLPRT